MGGAGRVASGAGTGVSGEAAWTTKERRKKTETHAKTEIVKAAKLAARTDTSACCQSQIPNPALSAEAVNDNTVLTGEPEERMDIQGPRQRAWL